jgi:hypothetical protein
VDGTIEVRQILPLNSGRDPVSQFLKKTLLTNPATNQVYLDSDLHIGQTIDVFGRSFLLYDADEWTKNFLDEKYGKHDWRPIIVDAVRGKWEEEQEPPPYNGWGSEEDSLGYCYSLHPKPPRKDIVKFITKDGMILRFSGKLKDPQPQDVRRNFVIVYYLSDDTVAVFELPQRNSGFRAGKFIQRGKWKNCKAGNRDFVPSDFEVGIEITINSFTFVTGVADEYAINYMESQADEFPQSDLFHIVKNVKGDQAKLEEMRKRFEVGDVGTKGNLQGYVPVDVAEDILHTSLKIARHQALTIARRWVEKPGFDYFSFMSALA